MSYIYSNLYLLWVLFVCAVIAASVIKFVVDWFRGGGEFPTGFTGSLRRICRYAIQGIDLVALFVVMLMTPIAMLTAAVWLLRGVYFLIVRDMWGWQRGDRVSLYVIVSCAVWCAFRWKWLNMAGYQRTALKARNSKVNGAN